jgi:hypothetical protein
MNLPACPTCGAPDWSPAHRCPRVEACCDCGQAADVWVPDPRLFSLTAPPDTEAYWSGDHDVPFCDGCLQTRLAHEKMGTPR